MSRFTIGFYDQPTIEVARNLLGCTLIVSSQGGRLAGRIVETEAYLSESDPACHAFGGMTPRNKSMFGPPGCLYVYSIHSRYCMNVVTESAGKGAAVLIRGLEPVLGIERMMRNRPVSSLRELTNGPGKLCQSLGIDKSLDGHSLAMGNQIWIESTSSPEELPVKTSTRIGISRARDLPLRFFIDGNAFVSGRASDHSVPRTRRLSDER
jgi:DNA-3-methyladenine glycosylase